MATETEDSRSIQWVLDRVVLSMILAIVVAVVLSTLITVMVVNWHQDETEAQFRHHADTVCAIADDLGLPAADGCK